MSTRLVKKFLQESLALDELAPSKDTLLDGNQIKSSMLKKKKYHKETKTTKNQKKYQKNKISNSVRVVPRGKLEQDDLMKSQVESMLLFDNAFLQTSSSAVKASLKRKTREGRERQKIQKRIRSMSGTLGNSRSSSSLISNRKLEPTYDKKKVESEKELKSLEDLAKRLFKGKKKNLL
mmetsp:Transcript_37468/g.44707  ORF Transcript_37468/g.44707 Transcript_37468/m.44707 type:complete len:178 (+) Transcript_37468:23-556(+)